MFKVKNNIGPEILNEVLVKIVYNGPALRSVSDFVKPRINSVHFGKDSLQYIGCNIWNIIPYDIKNFCNLDVFKRRIRTWSPDKCPCRLCKTYIQGVQLYYIQLIQNRSK